MNALLGKGLVYVIVAIASGFGGYVLNDRMQKPVQIPTCPDCHCPEPTVSIQPFEVEKIKGLRNFSYNPQFSGSIRVAGVDSTALQRMIDGGIERAFARYYSTSKKAKAPNRYTALFEEADAAFTKYTTE